MTRRYLALLVASLGTAATFLGIYLYYLGVEIAGAF